MWQSIVITALIALLLLIYFIVDRKPSKRRNAKETIQAWLVVYAPYLPEQEAVRLQHAVKHWQEKKPDTHRRLCEHFLRSYRRLTRQTHSLCEAVEKAPQTRIALFQPGDEVYLPKHDKQVVIHTLNEDNTYTVCDILEICHRVFEMELVKTEPTQSPDTRSSA